MKLPEIKIKEERGSTLLSVLLKGYNSEWGGHAHELNKDVEAFFKQNPLSEKSILFLNKIKALQRDGTDQEALYNIALTYNHPERVNDLINFLTKHKDYIAEPHHVREQLMLVLGELESSLSESLKNQMNQATSFDIEKRNQSLAEIKTRFNKLIDFFKPSQQTTSIKKITLLPTDFLYREESGSAFEFGDEMILRSHIDNPSNLEHEFLHSVINPIIDKLSPGLTEKQKEKITQLANKKLKQDYGEGYFSLLCEEFIRTYNDIFKKGEKPQTYEDFVQKISGITEDQFQKFLAQSESLKARCNELGINTIDDFKNKSQEYFERFEKNQLREIIFKFYQKYIHEKKQNNKISFERFVLEEFDRII